jgi:hypothetical protein
MVGISLASSWRRLDEGRERRKGRTSGSKLLGRHRGECPFRRDGEDLVIVFLAEDLVVYRNDDASGLHKLCNLLRWKIAVDSSVRG